MAGGPNLFARLHKWATRQDENFLTESLAVVLEYLLALAPEVGTRLINRLTGGFIDVPASDAGSIEIQPQVETGHGRPDLEISTPYRLVWVEVKAESDLRVGQLEGYRVLLDAAVIQQTRLILLTRYPVEFSAADARPDLQVRWFELTDWLELELAALQAAGEVAGFLGHQFLDFLRARGMTLTQVDKFMPEGLRAFGNLLNMLREAAAACKLSAKGSFGWDFLGISIDGAKYWVGVLLKEPQKLWFVTRTRIDREAAEQLGGTLTEATWVPGRYQCWLVAELDSEDVHFFSRTKVGQMQWLVAFLRDCLVKAHSIETADQPPIPEPPEGN